MGPRAGLSLLYSNFFVKLPSPTQKFTSQTIIVTGASSGLGLEAAKHLTQLGAAKVILAVRNIPKGTDAQRQIEEKTGVKGVVEVWELDLASYASVQAFARRAEGELDRLDAVIENAGISVHDFAMAEDNESTVTVNIISTFLLALLLLPTLRASALKHHTSPRISLVTSSVHNFVNLTAKSSASILSTLNDPQSPHAKMATRYFDSKLLQILYARSLASAISTSSISDATKPLVVINMLNPGLCDSGLFKDPHPAFKLQMKVMGRSSEEGSRALVDAVGRGKESHGAYLSDCKVAKVSDFVRSEKGSETEKRVWEEVNAKLEGIQKGVVENI